MNSDEQSDLTLLLSHYGDEGAPVLAEGLPHDAAGEETADGEASGGLSFYDLGAAGNDIAAQGWSVIAGAGKRGDELLARIKPLIDARTELGGTIRIYRVPERMTVQEAQRWRQDVYNNDDPDLIPRYQLLLGDLHEVPLELQQVQAPEGFVGRLAFDDPEGYDAYVEKVLRWERGPASPRRDPEALFFSVHDGTAATAMGHRGLIEPVFTMADEMRASGRFKASELRSVGDRDEPSPDELLRVAAGMERGVLFTMSHGAGAPRRGWDSEEAQRRGQGAMSFGRAGELPGEVIAGKPFARGGVWFMFACFGAGTPSRSKFHHWLARLAEHGQFRGRPESVLKSLPGGGQRPFIAALPKTALANPDGPLAFIGHLDLAWTYSFSEIDGGRQKGRPGKYYNVLKSLCRGDRVGVALQELERFHNDKNQELTDLYDLAEEARINGKPEVIDRARIGHLWMVRQDLSGYILLGDPAVELPLGTSPGELLRPRAPAVEEIRSAPEEDGAGPPGAASSDAPASFAGAAEDSASEAADPRPEAPGEVATPDRGEPRIGDASGASAPAVDAAPTRREEPPRASSPAAEERPIEAEARVNAGEIAGEVAVDDAATTIRWRIRWRFE